VVVVDAKPYHVVAHFRWICLGSPPLPPTAVRSSGVETKINSNKSTPLATRRSGLRVAVPRDSESESGELWRGLG
jgi:hypothetical protein